MSRLLKTLFLPLVPIKEKVYDIITDKTSLPGIEFEKAGKKIGKELLRKGIFSPRLLFNPVSIVRYFEFDFVSKGIGNLDNKNVLDVSSPFLFGFHLTNKYNVNYNYINPDINDLNRVKKFSDKIKFKGVYKAFPGDALRLNESDNSIDGIISISVIEHINDDGDTGFIKEAGRVLKPGGFLALTFPVSQRFEIEYREKDIYGLKKEKKDGKYFFQRIYDEEAINKRLLSQSLFQVSDKNFFGEKEKGFFSAYHKRWLKYGLFETVKDAYYISKKFNYFNSISELPGIGVMGIILRKKNEI